MNDQKKVLVVLADGFEEIEAFAPIDILRRANIKVITASVGNYTVTSARGVKVLPDMLLDNCLDLEFDAIVLPGGLSGSEFLAETENLIVLLKKQIQQKKYVAAICAAPALVLAGNNLLGKNKATCYPCEEFINMLENYVDEDIVISNEFITSKGVGTAFAFSLKLVELLVGESQAKELAEEMLIFGIES